jgi:hypothetical protein
MGSDKERNEGRGRKAKLFRWEKWKVGHGGKLTKVDEVGKMRRGREEVIEARLGGDGRLAEVDDTITVVVRS